MRSSKCQSRKQHKLIDTRGDINETTKSIVVHLTNVKGKDTVKVTQTMKKHGFVIFGESKNNPIGWLRFTGHIQSFCNDLASSLPSYIEIMIAPNRSNPSIQDGKSIKTTQTLKKKTIKKSKKSKKTCKSDNLEKKKCVKPKSSKVGRRLNTG